jgi:NitT/TauT family transport system permease protein
MVFAVLIVLILSPSMVKIENKWIFLGTVVIIEGVLLFNSKSKTAHDIILIVFLFLAVWEFATTKIPNPYKMIIPVPERVFAVFISDWRIIFNGIISSMQLLFTAMFFGLFLGVSLGIVVGWFERLRKMILPIAKVISPIPPIIYNPYAIVLLPSFRAASIFIIFCSIFWGVFINMILNVANVDRRIMESAKTLNTRSLPMFLQILFPYCLPRILNGMNITLSTSFMVLTAAEMIGATSGLGYFVRFYSDFADYTRVVAGIIMIGIIITLLNKLLVIVQNILIKWK